MKAYNIPLYIRLSIASFLGWSVLRVVYHYWQLHGTLPFGITLPGALSIAGFLIGLFAGSCLLLGMFFCFLSMDRSAFLHQIPLDLDPLSKSNNV